MIIHIVMGDNGQSYEDGEEWLVAAYVDKVKAEEHATLADKFVQENTREGNVVLSKSTGKPNPYDPMNAYRYNWEWSYYVVEVPLPSDVKDFTKDFPLSRFYKTDSEGRIVRILD